MSDFAEPAADGDETTGRGRHDAPMATIDLAADRLQRWSAEARSLPGDHQYGLLADDRAAAEAVIATHAELFDFGGVDLAGRVVLDAGCGHGESALAIAALGAERVIAVDVAEEEIEVTGDVAVRTGAALEAVAASVLDLPLDADTVDIVVSIEGIGVYSDLDRFLDEAARVIRSDGVVLMAERNDVLNPLLRRRARALWRAYELGPPGVHHGHEISVPYHRRRAELARELLPDASAAEVEAIAQNTFRMDGEAVAAACERFAATGELPNCPYDPDRAPIDLVGLTVEAPVEPKWMCDALRGRGLEPAVAGSWGVSSAPKRLLTRAMRSLGPLARFSAPAIRYRGRA